MINIIYCADTLGRFSAPDLEAELFVIESACSAVKNEFEGTEDTKPILISNRFVWDLFLGYFESEVEILVGGRFPEKDWRLFLGKSVRFCIGGEDLAFHLFDAKKINPSDILIGLIRGGSRIFHSDGGRFSPVKTEDKIEEKYCGVDKFSSRVITMELWDNG